MSWTVEGSGGCTLTVEFVRHGGYFHGTLEGRRPRFRALAAHFREALVRAGGRQTCDRPCAPRAWWLPRWADEADDEYLRP